MSPTRRERAATLIACAAVAIVIWSFFARVPFAVFVGMHITTFAVGDASVGSVRRRVLLGASRGLKYAWDPMAPRATIPLRRVLLACTGFIIMLGFMLYAATAAQPDFVAEQGAGLRVFASTWLFFALGVRLEAAWTEPEIARILAARASDGAA
jgi:hypothetical protein